jgi:HK97 gp10 family phage protein
MAGIKVEGFEGLTDYLEKMQLDPIQEKEAVRKSINVIKKNVEPRIPVKTGELKKSQKTSVRQNKGLTIGEYRLDKFYARFLEFGTSKSKKHKGFFSRAVRESEKEAIKTLSEELLK